MNTTSKNTSNFLIAEAQLALDEARKEKSIRTKKLGSPIQLMGKALAIHVRGNHVWIAENTAIARKLDLESGKTLQIYKGHTGPLTSLAFCDRVPGSGDDEILITGSWDQSIKLWDTQTKELVSSTDAHTDFVKSLLVLPSLRLLISGGSDKVVRLWDLSSSTHDQSLKCIGSISSHTRPVECLGGKALSDTTALLYTADTMGIIKAWNLTKREGWWQSSIQEEYHHHRTRINEMLCGNNQVWTASSDETVQVIHGKSPPKCTKFPPIIHPVTVRAILPLSLTDLAEPYLITGAGDIIRVYDVSNFEAPEFLNAIDAHWHDVTAICLWTRKYVGNDGKIRVEPWIISSSLDGTIRKWRLSGMYPFYHPSNLVITYLCLRAPQPNIYSSSSYHA
ncbi:WD40-repeat-containing domain protein [Collybia nuda]|uniref:WD40-repeat-containing domain protein n=1 Tax=Collybia nuda TaxID=64659 RepID=A0A9P6CAR5_9AGAR|nr:WD40-repeat-containing domain protein [Collybia nuda]